jgi:hypothetical protein
MTMAQWDMLQERAEYIADRINRGNNVDLTERMIVDLVNYLAAGEVIPVWLTPVEVDK